MKKIITSIFILMFYLGCSPSQKDVLFANAFKSNYDAGGIEKVIEPQLRQGKDILIVGHGAMNASIVCQIKDIPVKDFWSVKMKNAELVRLL